MAFQTLKHINNRSSELLTFPALLEKYKGEIARALPRHINPDRMVRISLTAFRTTPKLAECDPRSVFAAVIQAAQLGLEIGLMNEAYLVPFNGQCQLIPGYVGLMKLARQSGIVQDIYAHEVREKDQFRLTLGLERNLVHTPLVGPGGFPAPEEERGEVVGFYAVAAFKDGTRTFAAMSRKEVERIRDGSRGYQMASKSGRETPWNTHFVEMGLKTVIRRLCKMLPKSPELTVAIALDTLAERGQDQNLNLLEVVEGTYTPTIQEEVEPQPEAPQPAPQAEQEAAPKPAPQTAAQTVLQPRQTKNGNGHEPVSGPLPVSGPF